MDRERCACRYADFGEWISEHSLAPDRLSRETRRVLLSLEMMNIARAVHADLRGEHGRAWGLATSGIVLADCLTAAALSSLYSLGGSRAAAIGDRAAAWFRARAVGPDASPNAVASEREILRLIAQVVMDRAEDEPLPAFVERAVATIAARGSLPTVGRGETSFGDEGRSPCG